MAKRWICTVCGNEHLGDKAPMTCPVCGVGPEKFEVAAAPAEVAVEDPGNIDTARYHRLVELAATGVSSVSAMGSLAGFPDWDTVQFRGGQLARPPLNGDEAVSLRTVIGASAKHPLEIALPFYVSHMSFGALSREAKIALARGATVVGTVTCSGEGGLLEAEREAAAHYIYELGTAPFSHRDEAVAAADAVEIKIGQAAKPGLGGFLPAEKVTDEIAAVRGIPVGEESHSPARHHGLDSPEDLARRVAELREVIGGKPVGVKFAAGHVEADLAIALAAEPDFITIDCRGGGTGGAPDFVKDHVSLPAIFALHRARRVLVAADSRVTLCVTGGFRDSTDIAKALAMGADAVALGTASLIGIGCRQYRICHTGRCPVGVATQDPELRKRFDVDRGAASLAQMFGGLAREVADLARLSGRADVHDFDLSDLVTVDHEVAHYTDIEHA